MSRRVGPLGSEVVDRCERHDEPTGQRDRGRSGGARALSEHERHDPVRDRIRPVAVDLVEQRQLAVLGVGTDEREAIGLLDDVHVEAVDELLRECVAIGDVNRDVVQSRQLRGGRHVTGSVA